MSTSAFAFETILHRSIGHLIDDGQSVDDCLMEYPDQRQRLEPLLRLAERLGDARTLEAPADFRLVAASRMQQLVAAQPQVVPRQKIWTGWLERLSTLQTYLAQGRTRARVFAYAVMVAIFGLIMTSGMVMASTSALPGEPLYPLKRSVESARLTLSLSGVHDARLHLDFTARRVAEANALVSDQRTEAAAVPLRTYMRSIQTFNTYFAGEHSLSGREQRALVGESLDKLNYFEKLLAQLNDTSPASLSPLIGQAMDLTRQSYALIWSIVSNDSDFEKLRPAFTPQLGGTPPPFEQIVPLVTVVISPTVEVMATPYPLEMATWVPGFWPTPGGTPLPPEIPKDMPKDLPKDWPTLLPTLFSTNWPTTWPTPDGTPEPPPEWPTAWPTPDDSDGGNSPWTPEPTEEWPAEWPTPATPPPTGG